MKRKALFGAFCALLVAILLIYAYGDSSKEKTVSRDDFYEANFESSFGRDRLSSKYFQKHPLDHAAIQSFSETWKTSVPSRVEVLENPDIPKILHFVWLDERPLPPSVKAWKKSWKRLHSDWQICFWHKKDIDLLPTGFQAVFQKSSSLTEQEALFSSYILNKWGGVYVDLGFECIKPLNPLVSRYSFFSGFEPPLEKEKAHRVFHISPLLIGAKPAHPIVQMWQKALCDEISGREQDQSACKFTKRKDVKFAYIFLFEECVNDYFQKNRNTSELIVPPTYFFPIHQKRMKKFDANPKAHQINFWKSLGWSKRPLFTQLKPESMAIHHLGGSFEKNVHTLAKQLEHKQMKKEKKLAKILMNRDKLQKATEAEAVVCRLGTEEKSSSKKE